MSSSIFDLRELHNAYTRLTEKFKTLWTFHQFLQGIHKTFLGDAPGYQVDFQALYDQIKSVTTAMTFQPPPAVLELINQLESRLETVSRQLTADDEKIAPSYVRRFFEKVRTEDEKLLLALLRFYFYARQVSPETMDKIDFLITLVGARRSLDDGRYLTRFPQELAKLFGQLLALHRRSPVPSAEKAQVIKALGRLKTDIEECARFEDLTEKKILENLRTLKHRLGPVYYDVDVLSAILEANLAAKNRFQALYQEEERRILDSSQRLLELERELAKSAGAGSEEVLAELGRFWQAKEAFDKRRNEGEIRHAEVTRLAEAIDQLLGKLDLPGPPGAEAVEEALEEVLPAPAEEVEVTRAQLFVRDLAKDDRVPEGLAAPQPATDADVASPLVTDVVSDPIAGEHAAKILYSVEMVTEGTGSGHAAFTAALARLRLEPWEVRAARRLQENDYPPGREAIARDLLFLEGAALRIRIDEQAVALKDLTSEPQVEVLNSCARALVKAQELDRRFRQGIESSEDVPERLNELNRSRFRLLRSFAGLWLLHNARTVID